MTRLHALGVISDTHGLLRTEAVAALAGCERILHAGDIGGLHVLEGLAAAAPVAAVRGNNDREEWAREIPESRRLTIGGRRVFLVHEAHDIPDPAGYDLVIFGHSHVPKIERRGGVLFVNPGSAGPRRFRLPVTVARLFVGESIEAEIVELTV